MSQTLSLPGFDSADLSDTTSGVSETSAPPATKFPHTRAQLAAIARQHRLADSYENDAEHEDHSRVDSSFVTKVVGLLDEEHEDGIKSLLKDTYNLDDEMVSCFILTKEVQLFELASSG
jgi:hypothetical protein